MSAALDLCLARADEDQADSLTHHRAQTRRSTAIYHCGDATDRDLHPDLELDLGQGLDLGLFDDPGDISISAPGRGFELPIEGDLGGEGDVMIMGDGLYVKHSSAYSVPDASSMPPRESTPVANDAMPSPARSPGGSRLQTAAKRRKQPGREDEEGSIEEVEEVIARKPKASKKVKFDEVCYFSFVRGKNSVGASSRSNSTIRSPRTSRRIMLYT